MDSVMGGDGLLCSVLIFFFGGIGFDSMTLDDGLIILPDFVVFGGKMVSGSGLSCSPRSLQVFKICLFFCCRSVPKGIILKNFADLVLQQ